ncbi:MAG: L-lactate permease [Bacillota bacterium]
MLLPVFWGLGKVNILAAQTAGGAIGNIVAPGNVVLGTTTTGILGREGEVLKPAFMVAGVLALVIGIVTFLLA